MNFARKDRILKHPWNPLICFSLWLSISPWDPIFVRLTPLLYHLSDHKLPYILHLLWFTQPRTLFQGYMNRKSFETPNHPTKLVKHTITTATLLPAIAFGHPTWSAHDHLSSGQHHTPCITSKQTSYIPHHRHRSNPIAWSPPNHRPYVGQIKLLGFIHSPSLHRLIKTPIKHVLPSHQSSTCKSYSSRAHDRRQPLLNHRNSTTRALTIKLPSPLARLKYPRIILTASESKDQLFYTQR